MALTNILLKMIDYINYGYRGNLLTLGVQEIILSDDFRRELKNKFIDKSQDKILSPNMILKNIGFSEINTLDYPGMDNPDIEIDLNKRLPKKYYSKYDFILDAGYMEHIFNVPEMMRTIHLLLKPNGKIIHFNPCQGNMNHGFYNFQPTFYFSFYKTCKYQNIKIFLVESEISKSEGKSKITQIHENINNMNYFPKVNSSTYILACSTKTTNSSFRIPNQEFYQNIFDAKKNMKWERIPDKDYKKIVGNKKSNNHMMLTKKSFYI